MTGPDRGADDRARDAPAPARSRRTVLVTASPLPDGDASASRQWQLARSAVLPGVAPLLVYDGPGVRRTTSRRTVTGTELITLGVRDGGRLHRLLARQTRPFRTVRALLGHGVGRGDVAAVILPMNLMTIGNWAVFRLLLRCPVVVDVTERHDRQQFAHGPLTPYFIRHRWATFLTTRLVHRTTTASSSLARLMERSGLDTLTVPAPLDCAEFGPHRRPPLAHGLNLIYAGTPGRKDLLDVVMRGIALLDPEDQRRVHLTIAGIAGPGAGRSDLRPSALSGVRAEVRFVGRVPRARVLELLADSHFSILVRPDRGYATYGFPSKVPESLAAGCPVLLNHTSDLARYVRDGVEGVVLAGDDAAAVARGIARALRLSDDQWVAMSEAAHDRARESFDYRQWRGTVSAFVVGAGINEIRNATLSERNIT